MDGTVWDSTLLHTFNIKMIQFHDTICKTASTAPNRQPPLKNLGTLPEATYNKKKDLFQENKLVLKLRSPFTVLLPVLKNCFYT